MCSLDLRKTILINLDVQLRVDTNSIALRFISSNVMYVRNTCTIAFISRNLCISKLTTRLLVFQQCRWILSTRAGDFLSTDLFRGRSSRRVLLPHASLSQSTRPIFTRLSHRARGFTGQPVAYSAGSYTRTSRRSTGLYGRALC